MIVDLVVGAYRPADGYGGPITAIAPLAKELRQRSVNCRIVTTTLSAPGRADLQAGPDVVDGLEVVRLPVRMAYRWSSWVRWRKQQPPADLMHVFGAWNGLVYQAMRQARCPVVWEPIGMLTTLGRHRLMKTLWTPYHQYLSQRCAGVIWTSRRERQEAPIRVPESQAFFRPNPVTTPADNGDRKAARQHLGLPSDDLIWGYLGRIAPRKGIDTLLAAWPDNPDATLVFAGPLEAPDLAPQIDGRVRDRIVRLDALDETEKWAFLRAIDCLVLVPGYGENFGNVVAEAAAVGTPAIVSPAVGAAGYFADPGIVVADTTELQRHFRDSLIPPPPRGLPEALQLDNIVDTQLDIYRQLLE